MSYEVKQGNIFGRVGTGIGKGLAEQVPKEIERHRLSSGLKELGDKKDLTPFQQLAAFYSVPGAADRPELIRSGTEFLRHQAKANALSNQKSERTTKFPTPEVSSAQKETSGSQTPSLPQPEEFEQVQKGYIPPTPEEKLQEASQLFDKNPALFNYDPQNAINEVDKRASEREVRQGAIEKQYEKLDNIQKNVVNRLNEHSNRLGVEIPSDVYSKVENEAIQATKPKSKGGGGLTEQQAMKDYGKKLDEISREYEDLDSLGGWGITGRKAANTLSSYNNLQNKFAKRDDQRNFADKLISSAGVSPTYAYSQAYPVHNVPELNREIKGLKDLKSIRITAPGFADEATSRTLEIAPKLAAALGDKGSPLAVAYELEKKGYDPDAWIEYVTNHVDDLDLKKSQADQLSKPRNHFGTLADWWLQQWTGIR